MTAQIATAQIAELTTYLERRRAAILSAWQEMVEADPALSTASALTRSEFLNGIPAWLNAFTSQLRTLAVPPAAATQDDREQSVQEQEEASGHGSHRWQQGYQLHELNREWRHLHRCLDHEIELYRRSHAEFSAGLCHRAQWALSNAVHDALQGSVARYTQAQQAEASAHARDLEQALAELNALERMRGEALRAVSHDLRGGLTVVQSATGLLEHEKITEAQRGDLIAMTQRSIGSLHKMLHDLADLARLEAGQERRTVKPLDVARTLRELCATVEPLAQQAQLFLHTDGPPSLAADGDEVKVRRIAQNLLLNALKYTEQGGVTVAWGAHEGDTWMLCVEDSGPGLYGPQPGGAAASAPAGERRATARPGEGIGLSIVKRLCELLDARLEVQTATGVGSTFRVIFPRHYNPVAPIS